MVTLVLDLIEVLESLFDDLFDGPPISYEHAGDDKKLRRFLFGKVKAKIATLIKKDIGHMLFSTLDPTCR